MIHSTPIGTARSVGADTKIVLAPAWAAFNATAYPIFPLERFVIYRTGSIASCVPPALTITVLPCSSPVFPK